MSHRLLSAAAARLGIAASAAAPVIAAAAPAAPLVPAAGDEAVDVVTVADAQAAVTAAETRGATAELQRTAAVFASAEGKANPAMAAWMLQNNPTATAAAISTALAGMPAAAVVPAAAAAAAPAAPGAAAPAAPGTTAAPAPAPAPAAITTPLTQTPKVEVGAGANGGEVGGMSQAEIDKMWDAGISAAAGGASNSMGASLAPGIPRTGN